MNAKDFYYLAEHLLNHVSVEQSEAVYREVISLSYYACFHLATPIAEGRISKPSNTGMHKQLCQGLKDYGKYNPDKLAKPLARKFFSLGLKLEEARKERTKASYHLTTLTFTKIEAAAQMQQAQSIMQLIGEIQQASL